MENKDKVFPNFDPTNDLTQATTKKDEERFGSTNTLLESEIKDANQSTFVADIRLLGVSYNTYKKYAEI